MLLYFLLAAGAAVLGYEIYGSTKPAEGALGYLVVPAGATVLEPDGTISTLSQDTPSTSLKPGSLLSGDGNEYVVMGDGSLSHFGAGAEHSGAVMLPAGTTIMGTDGSNSSLTADTSSAAFPAGTAVFEDGAVYVVASDGSLHTAQATS